MGTPKADFFPLLPKGYVIIQVPYFISSSQPPYLVGSISVPILQMKSLRLRGPNSLLEGHET